MPRIEAFLVQLVVHLHSRPLASHAGRDDLLRDVAQRAGLPFPTVLAGAYYDTFAKCDIQADGLRQEVVKGTGLDIVRCKGACSETVHEQI